MAGVRILITPNHMKIAASKVAQHLKIMDYDTIFLNFSRDLEESVGALAEGAPYDYIIERLMELKLIPEPLGAWEYGAKPILMALRGILQKKPNVKIYCYRDPSYDLISTKIAEKIAIMIFRASSIERIETEEWEAVLNSLLEAEAKALPEETGLIMKMAESCENCICVAGFDGRRIRARLMEEGFEVSLAHMYVPYHFTPLKILMREMRRATSREAAVSHDKITRFVEYHTQFIREYVTMNEDYDEAYQKWASDKVPWLMPAYRMLH